MRRNGRKFDCAKTSAKETDYRPRHKGATKPQVRDYFEKLHAQL